MTTKIPVELSSTPGIVDGSNATAITIDSSENVGIGTSSPVTKLHVMDGTAQSGISHTFIYDSTSLSIEAGEPAIQLRAEDSGTHGGSLLWRYGNNVFSATANPTDDTIDYIYGVTNANDFAVHSGSQMTSYRKIMTLGADGNVEIGDGNLKFASGHGIDFSSTGDGSGSMSNELLDDYEEGSWTPTLPNGGSITVNTATYTKIGRKVTAYCFIQFTATNNTSIFFIGGLPYNTPNNGNYYAGGSLSYSGTEDTSSFSDPLVIYNGDDIYFHYLTGTAAQVKNNQFAGRTVSMIIQVHYDAA